MKRIYGYEALAERLVLGLEGYGIEYGFDENKDIETVAAALDAARREGLEEAAEIISRELRVQSPPRARILAKIADKIEALSK